MEFFGYTLFGPQNYIKDVMKEDYIEPMNENDVKSLMENIRKSSGKQCSELETIRLIDCYLGRVNGFAYGSMIRFIKMKRKGVIKPIGPDVMYRMTPTTSIEYGWWQHDPALFDVTWHKTCPRYPQPSSPNTLILDKVRKNNKYASLF